MRNRKLATLALSAVALAGTALAAPTAGATTATFTLTGGNLSVAQPTGTATLTGSALALGGTTMSGQLGSTTVTDSRGQLLGGFDVTMTSSSFQHANFATNGYEIPASAVTGYSGVVVPTGVAVPVGTTAVTAVSLAGAGGDIVTVTGVTGAASIAYNPTVSVAVPGDALAGTYTGTVTQTAS